MRHCRIVQRQSNLPASEPVLRTGAESLTPLHSIGWASLQIMTNPIESQLDSLYTRCGLNADWSVSAWCISGAPNNGAGTYITDNEDGTMSLVYRDFSVDGDSGTVLATWDATWPDDNCPECARSFGPHYSGVCNH